MVRTVDWKSMSDDEVIAALKSAPSVAGAWSEEGTTTYHRYNCSGGSFTFHRELRVEPVGMSLRRVVGNTAVATVFSKKTSTESKTEEGDVEVTTIRSSIRWHWRVFDKEGSNAGSCGSLEEAKQACDRELINRGWRFAKTMGNEE
jgi:hypothetical protein